MNPEYIVSREQIKWINKQYGGSLRSDAEIETALYMGKGRSIYTKIAHLWRAVLVGHPFSDGNKRTALMVAMTILDSCNIGIGNTEKEVLTGTIMKIAGDNITDIKRIARLIRYAVEGD